MTDRRRRTETIVYESKQKMAEVREKLGSFSHAREMVQDLGKQLDNMNEYFDKIPPESMDGGEVRGTVEKIERAVDVIKDIVEMAQRYESMVSTKGKLEGGVSAEVRAEITKMGIETPDKDMITALERRLEEVRKQIEGRRRKMQGAVQAIAIGTGETAAAPVSPRASEPSRPGPEARPTPPEVETKVPGNAMEFLAYWRKNANKVSATNKQGWGIPGWFKGETNLPTEEQARTWLDELWYEGYVRSKGNDLYELVPEAEVESWKQETNVTPEMVMKLWEDGPNYFRWNYSIYQDVTETHKQLRVRNPRDPRFTKVLDQLVADGKLKKLEKGYNNEPHLQGAYLLPERVDLQIHREEIVKDVLGIDQVIKFEYILSNEGDKFHGWSDQTLKRVVGQKKLIVQAVKNIHGIEAVLNASLREVLLKSDPATDVDCVAHLDKPEKYNRDIRVSINPLKEGWFALLQKKLEELEESVRPQVVEPPSQFDVTAGRPSLTPVAEPPRPGGEVRPIEPLSAPLIPPRPYFGHDEPLLSSEELDKLVGRPEPLPAQVLAEPPRRAEPPLVAPPSPEPVRPISAPVETPSRAQRVEEAGPTKLPEWLSFDEEQSSGRDDSEGGDHIPPPPRPRAEPPEPFLVESSPWLSPPADVVPPVPSPARASAPDRPSATVSSPVPRHEKPLVAPRVDVSPPPTRSGEPPRPTPEVTHIREEKDRELYTGFITQWYASELKKVPQLVMGSLGGEHALEIYLAGLSVQELKDLDRLKLRFSTVAHLARTELKSKKKIDFSHIILHASKAEAMPTSVETIYRDRGPKLEVNITEPGWERAVSEQVRAWIHNPDTAVAGAATKKEYRFIQKEFGERFPDLYFEGQVDKTQLEACGFVVQSTERIKGLPRDEQHKKIQQIIDRGDAVLFLDDETVAILPNDINNLPASTRDPKLTPKERIAEIDKFKGSLEAQKLQLRTAGWSRVELPKIKEYKQRMQKVLETVKRSKDDVHMALIGDELYYRPKEDDRAEGGLRKQFDIFDGAKYRLPGEPELAHRGLAPISFDVRESYDGKRQAVVQCIARGDVPYIVNEQRIMLLENQARAIFEQVTQDMDADERARFNDWLLSWPDKGAPKHHPKNKEEDAIWRIKHKEYTDAMGALRGRLFREKYVAHPIIAQATSEREAMVADFVRRSEHVILFDNKTVYTKYLPNLLRVEDINLPESVGRSRGEPKHDGNTGTTPKEPVLDYFDLDGSSMKPAEVDRHVTELRKFVEKSGSEFWVRKLNVRLDGRVSYATTDGVLNVNIKDASWKDQLSHIAKCMEQTREKTGVRITYKNLDADVARLVYERFNDALQMVRESKTVFADIQFSENSKTYGRTLSIDVSKKDWKKKLQKLLDDYRPPVDRDVKVAGSIDGKVAGIEKQTSGGINSWLENFAAGAMWSDAGLPLDEYAQKISNGDVRPGAGPKVERVGASSGGLPKRAWEKIRGQGVSETDLAKIFAGTSVQSIEYYDLDSSSMKQAEINARTREIKSLLEKFKDAWYVDKLSLSFTGATQYNVSGRRLQVNIKNPTYQEQVTQIGNCITKVRSRRDVYMEYRELDSQDAKFVHDKFDEAMAIIDNSGITFSRINLCEYSEAQNTSLSIDLRMGNWKGVLQRILDELR